MATHNKIICFASRAPYRGPVPGSVILDSTRFAIESASGATRQASLPRTAWNITREVYLTFFCTSNASYSASSRDVQADFGREPVRISVRTTLCSYHLPAEGCSTCGLFTK